jgi:23S rRNA (guanosine2251-2'-O)-methyltransferase
MTDGEWIYGRNPVLETLRSDRREVTKIWIASGVEITNSLAEIIAQAEQRKILIDWLPKTELDGVAQNNQGVLALVSVYKYVGLEEITAHAARAKEDPFVLILDMVQDPQNLGTLLRTAEAVGVHGVIIPSRRSAKVTPAVVSASSGASEYLRIAQRNIAQAIRALKEQGVWVAGLDASADAQALQDVNLSGPLALVVGHEGSGMRRLVQESCDYLVRIPMRGAIESLNAAVAGSIVLFHVWEQRNFAGLRSWKVPLK